MLRTDLIAPIPELLHRHAAAHGGKCAYRDAQTSVSYAALLERTGRLAGHLADNGITANDTVAIFLPNSVPWVESCFAIARAGAISVPISYNSTETEIAYRLADANCKAVFTTAERGDLIARLQASAPNLKTLIVTDRGTCAATALSYADLLKASPKSAPRDAASLHDTAFILYTSGTTGRAKGVALTVHGMLWVNAACWAPIAGLCEQDTVLSPLPLFHSYALNLSVLSILATGATCHIMEKFSTSEAVRLLNTGEFTFFPGVPTMFHYLLQATRGQSELEISQSPAVRFGRRDHAGNAEPRVRRSSRRQIARRLRHHRNLDHGDDELADRRARARLVRHSAAGTRGAHRRSGRPRCRAEPGR